MKYELFSEDVAKVIVKCLEDATGDRIKEDIILNRLRSTNSIPSRIWDYINSLVLDNLEKEDCVAILSKSGPWQMVIVYDKKTRNIITIMREKRFAQLKRQQSKRRKQHYIDALALVFNNDLLAEAEQLSLLEEPQADIEEMRNRVHQLLRDLGSNEDLVNNHVLFLFDTYGFDLASVRAIMVTPRLDIAQGSEINLSQYVTAKESVIADKVSSPKAPANNPNRGLKLGKKARERQEKNIHLKMDTQDKEKKK